MRSYMTAMYRVQGCPDTVCTNGGLARFAQPWHACCCEGESSQETACLWCKIAVGGGITSGCVARPIEPPFQGWLGCTFITASSARFDRPCCGGHRQGRSDQSADDATGPVKLGYCITTGNLARLVRPLCFCWIFGSLINGVLARSVKPRCIGWFRCQICQATLRVWRCSLECLACSIVCGVLARFAQPRGACRYTGCSVHSGRSGPWEAGSTGRAPRER
jgi:hypothetical protein